MSYAQRKEISGNRTMAIIMVVVLQFALGYAIVTGLAYNVIKKAAQDLKTFDVEEQPPPPEEPPPPPKDMPKVPPPPTMPPPMVRMQEAPPPTIAVQVAPTPPPFIPPVAPARPTIAPPKPRIEPAKAKGSLIGLFSDADYPASAQSAGAEGTAQASLTVGPDGRVASCNITRSTGNSALDSATCNVLRRRARFTPAHDASGNAVTDTYQTPPIKWQLVDQ
jgi:protein TonB